MKTFVKKHLSSVESIDVFIELFLDKEEYSEEWEGNMVECRCAVCKKCAFIIDGPHQGKCYYGGPYIGYVNV